MPQQCWKSFFEKSPLPRPRASFATDIINFGYSVVIPSSQAKRTSLQYPVDFIIVSHFSPVPPGEREYAENYRKELEPFEAQLVEVSGRCKEFRDHPERKDLQSLLLINLTIRTFNKKNLIKLSHLWVLTKHVQRAGVEPKIGRRVKFSGPVYAYYRLGGKSKQRGLHGLHDFSILTNGKHSNRKHLNLD